jgi:hypothetical protein
MSFEYKRQKQLPGSQRIMTVTVKFRMKGNALKFNKIKFAYCLHVAYSVVLNLPGAKSKVPDWGIKPNLA